MSTTRSSQVDDDRGTLSRRALLVGAGTATLAVGAVGVLAACSSDGSGTGGSGGSGGDGGSGSTGGTGGSSDTGLAQVADVPVGGALSVTIDGAPAVLVQATSGTITALSAVCTHQGCTVRPGDGALDCPCHGSVFALDGSVKQDPATEPLPSLDVHVTDGAVYAGKA
jgi:Rieske Fe-S protein